MPQSDQTIKKEAERIGPPNLIVGAGEESRTLDLNLGKVALYQLSYSRNEEHDYSVLNRPVNSAVNPDCESQL
jgi:hypothetical protein